MPSFQLDRCCFLAAFEKIYKASNTMPNKGYPSRDAMLALLTVPMTLSTAQLSIYSDLNISHAI